MARAKLSVLTSATHRRLIRARGPARSDGCVKPQRELRCCRRSLIYKVPVFRWSGATARFSRFHIPVETSTPPRRRKLHILRFRPNGESSRMGMGDLGEDGRCGRSAARRVTGPADDLWAVVPAPPGAGARRCAPRTRGARGRR